MKTRLILFGASAVLVALLLFGVTVVVPVLGPKEMFYGTFENKSAFPQKAVRFPGGFKDYALVSDTIPVAQGTEKIVDRRTDSEGNSWYKTQAARTDGKYLTLQKISKAGTVLELMAKEVADFSSGDFPTKIDPAGSVYRIMYRTGK